MRKSASFIIVGIAISLALAFFVAPVASPHPDGLEWVAEKQGFIEKAQSDSVTAQSPLADYAVRGLQNNFIATGIAGVLGTLLVAGIGYGLARQLSRRNSPNRGKLQDQR